MQKNWTQNSPFPGSIKQVYGAKYPPLQLNSVESRGSGTSTTKKSEIKFRNYENSVSDVWDVGVTVDDDLAITSAAKVLELHAANKLPSRDDIIMPNCNPVPSKNNKAQAMQRLATQKEPIPGILESAPPIVSSASPHSIYPRLPEVSLSSGPSTVSYSGNGGGGGGGSSSMSTATLSSVMPRQSFTAKNGDLSRFDRLRQMLGVSSSSQRQQPSSSGGSGGEMVNMEQLRKDCWLGIPHKIRPLAWRILSGYVPANVDRREEVLKRKRDEYWRYVEQYFHTRYDEQYQVTFRQIHIDIPRMCPLIPLFQQKLVQEIFERVLYIWAIRRPACGYVQGINDLVTPFFVVFLSEFIPDDVEVGTFDVAQLSRARMEIVEADSFWCVCALLDTIQENYTFAQPGIQRKVQELKDLIGRVEPDLYHHFDTHGVEFLQFSFRWFNNLLMREIPLRATIRLWDTYLSERNGFSQFHTYVCGAFLRIWSRQLQSERDFQGIMLLLQNLPTQSWNDQQICELTAHAYSLMQTFHGAKNHFQ